MFKDFSMATINQNRNKASVHTKDTYKFDSLEERDFYSFLKDALRLGLIESFTYQPDSFLLIPKAVEKIKVPYKKKSGYKTIEKVLYQPHSYTADFKFKLTDKFFECFPMITNLLRLSNDNLAFIDIKGAYNRFGGDRQFAVNQKLVYAKYGIHINKLVPEKFFQKLGAAPDEEPPITEPATSPLPAAATALATSLYCAIIVAAYADDCCVSHARFCEL